MNTISFSLEQRDNPYQASGKEWVLYANRVTLGKWLLYSWENVEGEAVKPSEQEVQAMKEVCLSTMRMYHDMVRVIVEDV